MSGNYRSAWTGLRPEHPVTQLEGDDDVFGDHSVVILSTPAIRQAISLSW
jgi:hypothetical protein